MKQLPRRSLVEERYFPFECSISYGVEHAYRALHWHQEMEICYIKEGTGNYLINGVEYAFAPGDIFIINNDEIHLCHDDHNLIMQVIMFDPAFLCSGTGNPMDQEYLRPFLESQGGFGNKLDAANSWNVRLAELLSKIEEEYDKQPRGYELMIKALLLQFLTLIIRHYAAAEKGNVPDAVSSCAADKVRAMVTYLDTHYYEDIGLCQLASDFDISVPYLCSSFKTLTNLSPIEYVIRRRIAEAKHLLTNTDKSVLAISEECGFRSLSNFNHQFKALVGCSPSTYRKS